ELGLAVGSQILVAEAARDLVIAVQAGHHQELLEQLRRLRQRIEAAGLYAAGHQIVTRALGRGAGQDRRLGVDEIARVEKLPDRTGQLRAQPEVALQARTAKIEKAILQAHFLAVLVGHQQRQR